MSETDAAQLIIENIQMLDDAQTIVSNVEKKVFDEINNFIKESVEDFNKESGEIFIEGDWFGFYEIDLDDSGFTWFSPKKWEAGEDGSCETLASYILESRAKSDAEDNWHFTSLFPTGKCSFGFLLAFERVQFQKPPTVKELRKFTLAKNQTNTAIEEAGFKFDPEESQWFLPFNLDVKEVAENYVTNTLFDAFKPITEALKKLQEAHPHFVSIIEDAKKAFSGIALEDESECRNSSEQ